MVTDSAPLEDKSFNQASWEGLEQAVTKYGIDARALVSTTDADKQPNVDQAVASGCKFVLTVGYDLADPTKAAATANPGTDFSIVDDDSIDLPNVKPIVFATQEAAYLAGYVAAGVTKSGKVATFGGDKEPAVTLFMDGFSDGIDKYNEVHGTSVKLLGWNKAKQDGTFANTWDDVHQGKVLSQAFISQGADIILPVAGVVGEGTLAAAQEVKAQNVLVIWVDNDGYLTEDPQYQKYLLTSVEKKTQGAVGDIVGSILDGSLHERELHRDAEERRRRHRAVPRPGGHGRRRARGRGRAAQAGHRRRQDRRHIGVGADRVAADCKPSRKPWAFGAVRPVNAR